MKRILILHDLAVGSRRTNRDHVYNFAKYHPGNLYVFHHVRAPITDALKRFPFDGIIMNYCFLGNRASFYDIQSHRWSWLKDSPATKIALCQDDYTDHLTLDEWLRDLDVAVIYSPVQENLDVLYPNNWGRAKFKEGLTSYTDSKQIAELESYRRPFSERQIDVGTRVRYLPPVFGRYGRQKGESAEQFDELAAEAGFKTDISTKPEDVLFGSNWLRFLGNCKFTLGSKGGSSIADPRGEVRKKVARFLESNPGAGFAAVEDACFPGLDNKYVFAGVSPRLFEAAALGTCQILLRDEYVGGIEAYKDYIPLDNDLSNIEEVFDLMRDEDACKSMIASCYDKLIGSNQFDYSFFVEDVLNEIGDGAAEISENEADILETHFLSLAPFRRLRQKLGGIWETSFKSQLAMLAYLREQEFPADIADWPPEFQSSPGFLAPASGIGVQRRANFAAYSDYYREAIAAGDPSILQDMHDIAKQFDEGELSPETFAWMAGVITWWDMCEYIYELPMDSDDVSASKAVE